MPVAMFSFPSATEAFCNVVLEAFASGLPAVVSDVGGCMELVEKSAAGLVARAGDVDGFYRHCLAFLDNREQYLDMRAKGFAFAGGKSWASVNGALIARYQELVRTKAGAGE